MRKGCCLLRLLIVAAVLVILAIAANTVRNHALPEARKVATEYARKLKDAGKADSP